MRKKDEGSYFDATINNTIYKAYRFTDRHVVYGKTAAERDKKIQEYKDLLEHTGSDKITKNNIHFGDFCKQWLVSVKRDLAERTYDDYEDIINVRIIKNKQYNIGNKKLQSLTAKMFTDFLDSLTNNYSLASIKKTWSVCRQVIKSGMQKGFIPHINLEEVRIPKENEVAVSKKEIPVIDVDDMECLYQECISKYPNGRLKYGNNALVIIFIMYSGLRLSEATGLKYENVFKDYIKVNEAATRVVARDEDNNPILNKDGQKTYISKQKTPKSKSGYRTIPLSKRALEVIRTMKELYPDHDKNDFVFTTSNRTKIEPNNVEKTLRRILRNSKCKRKDYTPHCLRHGFGSILLSKGVEIKVISKLLGHKNIT